MYITEKNRISSNEFNIRFKHNLTRRKILTKTTLSPREGIKHSQYTPSITKYTQSTEKKRVSAKAGAKKKQEAKQQKLSVRRDEVMFRRRPSVKVKLRYLEAGGDFIYSCAKKHFGNGASYWH